MRFLSSSQPRRLLPNANATATALGKIPTHPEFLSHRTGQEPLESFESWLEAGIGLASHRHGPAWTNAFELGGVQGFVWRAPGTSKCDILLSGIMFPSCDSVGRHYPLAVVGEVPARIVKCAPHVVPLAFGDFLERAHDASADFATLAPGDLASRLSVVGPPTAEDVERAAADYDAWCSATPAANAWSAVFTDHPVERSRLVIEGLRDLTAAIRGVETPERAMTVRLPLGEVGPASAALWLDVVRRLCGWNATVPSTFWAVEAGSLLVALGDADPGMLASLWYRDPNGDGIWDATLATEAPPASMAPLSVRMADAAPPLRFDGPMTNLLASLTR